MLNALLVSVLIAASIISRAYGDDTDDKIRRLEARITQLEQRLAALEEKATIDKTVKQSSSSVEGWRDKQTWRQLKIGMTKHEVQAILGEPGRPFAYFRSCSPYRWKLQRNADAVDRGGKAFGRKGLSIPQGIPTNVRNCWEVRQASFARSARGHYLTARFGEGIDYIADVVAL